MRYVALSFCCLLTACVGKVDGDPWSGKAVRTAATLPSDCLQVRGSKYTVCGAIDGELGATTSTDSTGTTYAVRGGTYAR